jgi:pilus assembly protein CpaF
MLGRLETLHIAGSGFPLSAVRNQIADAIDLIVQLKRFSDGHRRVMEICEVCGMKDGEIELNTIFERNKGEALSRTENPLRGRSLIKGLQDI